MLRKVAPHYFAWLMCLTLLLSACVAPLPFFEQSFPNSPILPTTVPYVTVTPAPDIPAPRNYKDSGEFSEQVRTGQVLPVEQRLPEDPKVVRPVETVGKYGGTWRMAIQSTASTEQFIRTVAYEPLVRWSSDWSTIEPNLVESYSVNDDATQYIFRLRHGLRWSDGEPFTTADIRFWYTDVLKNHELTPLIPAWLLTSGHVVGFEFLDDFTFKVHFLTPNGLFLEQLAAPDALAITSFPAHYAQKFHQKYLSPDELQQQLQLGGYASWTELFTRKVGVNPLDLANYTDPARPRLSAWVMKNSYHPDAETITWTRNPYYWKVDPAGNQLPYIDTVLFQVVHNVDDVINLTLDDQVDMQNLSELGIDKDTIIQKNKGHDLPASQYKFFKVQNQNNVLVINLNLTQPDPTKRTLFQNRNFRVGLSYAINRQEILNLLFKGSGKPWQAAPPEGSYFYDPVMGTQYTEFNVEKAKDYLDQVCYTKDDLGHRLGPDGRPITFTIEVLESEPQQIAMLNMVSRYLADVGINMQLRIDPLPVFKAIVESNQHDAAASAGSGTYFKDMMLRPTNYIPNSSAAYWANNWVNWYNQRTFWNGDLTYESISSELAVYDQIVGAQSPQEQIRLMKEALGIARNNFWTIGIALGPDRYGIVSASLHNVPAEMPSGWIYPDPAPTNPEQYYFEN
jgi:peptide/nickel transport system substrate-binding protein